MSLNNSGKASSCFQSIDYNAETGELDLRFHNPTRGAWRYYNVQPFEAAGLITASSQGEYFNEYIRNGSYQYDRIG